ncbi:MAG: transposase [Thaumarchaeota archaeon]|nr:transposase [Nitrososphaerota archaeon]
MQHAYRKYQVAISLAADQVRLIDSYRAAQRHAYNWSVGRIMSGDAVSEYGLYKELTAMRREQEWVRAAPAWIQRAGIQDACTAHKLAARFGRGGLRHRTRKRHSAISARCALAPRVVDRYGIMLPSFGAVRAAVPNEVMEHDPRSYELTKTRSGRYVLYVSCRVGTPPRACCAPANATVKGVDRGTVEPTVVVTMDRGGSAIAKDSCDTAAPFRDGRAEYQEMQSRMSKMNKHSNRLRRLHARLRRHLQKTRNRRQYAECVAAKHVCDDHAPGVIVLEDIKVSSMTRRGRGSHKRGLNREMRFVRHRAVEQRIRNRAELAGIQIITVDPQYTSQECARCGHVDKPRG